MAQTNYLSVYQGPDSLVKYYDPDFQPPLPLVELPETLNPFRRDNVRIYAKMMTVLPAHNLKCLPALNMLQKGVRAQTRTIVEPSSGSTVVSLAVIARAIHRIDDVRAFLSNKVAPSLLGVMKFFGLQVVLFGGPLQPGPKDPRGSVGKARALAESNESIFNPGQYENDANPEAHMRWSGPQILRQLPEINVFCAGMGTTGSITGIGTYLKQKKPSVTVVGVCNTGDPVPGPRPYPLVRELKFPWADVTDAIEEVNSMDSYRLSMMLSREGLICGPSSGLALQGLYNFIQKRKDQGLLSGLVGDDGSISCVFLCGDLPFQHFNDYFAKLGDEFFRPIVNERLLDVEYILMSHNGSALSPMVSDFRNTFPALNPASHLVDLRQAVDFDASHLPGAVNISLRSLKKCTPSPFDDAKVLEEQWLELKDKFSGREAFVARHARIKGVCSVTFVCYDGETAHVASSILRAQGIEAYSLIGGMGSVAKWNRQQREKL
ncbi:tryptophan synthase beta subunit-like PLP-dependent enzyme [Trichophaea hybrida]|nr:tryptophan synthase beta subunit-like PLP-dependent enzyme [Trichophaea hybrida]